MTVRLYFLLSLCLLGHFRAHTQVVSVQLPLLYAGKGWQLSQTNPAAQNDLLNAHTLGLFDLAITVKNRFTVDLSYQLEEWQLDYISLPLYIEQSGIGLEETKPVLSSLLLGTTRYRSAGYLGWRSGQLKLGLSKNWWSHKWALDVGARYVFYTENMNRGISQAVVSGEKLYRVDRWSRFSSSALQFSLRPTAHLSNRISLSARASWLVHPNVKHGIGIERLSGLEVPAEYYEQIESRTEHRFFVGIGLYYTSIPNVKVKEKKTLMRRVTDFIFKY